jgi:hypothetical protein
MENHWMDKKTLGLMGAVSVLALTTGVSAARAQAAARVMNPASYAELLQPIPDAVNILQVVDAQPAKPAKVEKVQWHHHHWGHHHHHSHHHHWRHHHHWYHHHHSHHHHWHGPGFYINPFGGDED